MPKCAFCYVEDASTNSDLCTVWTCEKCCAKFGRGFTVDKCEREASKKAKTESVYERRTFAELFTIDEADLRTQEVAKEYSFAVHPTEPMRKDVCIKRTDWRTPSFDVRWKDRRFELKVGHGHNKTILRQFAKTIGLAIEPPQFFCLDGIQVPILPNGTMTKEALVTLQVMIRSAYEEMLLEELEL